MALSVTSATLSKVAEQGRAVLHRGGRARHVPPPVTALDTVRLLPTYLTVAQRLNSEVLPSGSVAVAVMTAPATSGLTGLNVKVVFAALAR